MLPASAMVLGLSDAATGVIAGAVIGAFVGVASSVLTYRGNNRNLRHKDEEAWRKVSIDATQAFIYAWHELRSLLYPASEGLRIFDKKASEKVDPLATKCAQTVEVVTLLFGRDSDAGGAADKVDGKIADLKKLVLDTGIEWDPDACRDIKRALEAVRDAREEFVQMAHHALKPKSLHRDRSHQLWPRKTAV